MFDRWGGAAFKARATSLPRFCVLQAGAPGLALQMSIGKARLKGGLRALGILDTALWLRDLARVARAIPRNAPYWMGRSPDGLPLPPSLLIYLVAGTPEIPWFLEGGRRAAESIRTTLGKNGVDIGRIRSVLDFGCGCGRVTRHWASLDAKVFGTDVNREAIEWCRKKLPFGHFEANGPNPPLPYEAGTFDLVYALSVFTHLTAELQRPWMEELLRVTSQGGHVLFSTHGTRYLKDLTPEQQEQFTAGRLVVRNEEAAGSNRCGAYHPLTYVRETLTAGFRLVDVVLEGALGNPYQDLYLVSKS